MKLLDEAWEAWDGTLSRSEMARKSLALLGEARFLAFFAAIRKQGGVFAVKLFDTCLNEGRSVHELFFPEGELPATLLEDRDAVPTVEFSDLSDRDAYGYLLKVMPLGPTHFRIEFGCNAGPMAGDGADWIVTFDAEGNVVSAGRGFSAGEVDVIRRLSARQPPKRPGPTIRVRQLQLLLHSTIKFLTFIDRLL